MAKKSLGAKSGAEKRGRRIPQFPTASFEEALTIATAIHKFAAGQKVRRLTLFDQMEKSPDSGPSRQLIINSNKYGLTSGAYNGEFLELTASGKLATASDASEVEKAQARFELAIKRIAPFNALYESLKGNRLPAASVLEDTAKDNGISASDVKEGVDIFTVNAKFVGILRQVSGAERILPIEQILEEIAKSQTDSRRADASPLDSSNNNLSRSPASGKESETDWNKTCFYIAPIGEDNSEHRQHSDLLLGSIVEPALEEFGINVVRADMVGKPGMITAQIIEHLVKAKLVIADLSFHNPNVFYELCLRHVCRLPTVQLIRKGDRIPFDLGQFRTIQIDTTSVYSMVPNLQTYKAEVSTQVRAALKDPDATDNPVSTFYPSLKATF